MFPTDGEFLVLYVFYSAVFIFLLSGVLLSKSKRQYVANLAFYLLYAGVMAYLFSDEENFKGGGSLVVLVYGQIFLLIHLSIVILIKVFISFKRRLVKWTAIRKR